MAPLNFFLLRRDLSSAVALLLPPPLSGLVRRALLRRGLRLGAVLLRRSVCRRFLRLLRILLGLRQTLRLLIIALNAALELERHICRRRILAVATLLLQGLLLLDLPNRRDLRLGIR